MFTALNRLSIRARTALSVALFVLVCLLSTYSAFEANHANIHLAEQQKRGAEVLAPIMEAMHGLAILRQDVAQGHTDHVLQGLNAVDGAFADLGAAHARLSAPLGLEDAAGGDLEAAWTRTRDALRSGQAPDADAQLQALMGDLAARLAQVGNASHLVLDPDLDSYYLMDVFVFRFPEVVAHLADLGVYAGQDLRGAGPAGPESRARYAVYAHAIGSADAARIEASVRTALREDPHHYGTSPTLAARLEPALERYTSSVQALAALLARLERGDRLPSEQVSDAMEAALEATAALSGRAREEMVALLDMRTAAHWQVIAVDAALDGLGLLVALAFFLVVMQSLITPLRRFTAVMERLARGDLEVAVPYREAQAEIGAIAGAVEVFRKNGLKAQEAERDKREAQAQAQAEREKALAQLADSFEGRVQGIIAAVAAAAAQMAQLAQGMNTSTVESSARAVEAAGNAQESSENVQAVAAAAEEMTATIREISSQTQGTSRLVSEAAEKVRGADAFAEALQKASGEIRSVMNLISGIAGQINLLALNATIESARAGEAGRGFAVVANEVRALAGQTDKSIHSIERVIGEMGQASEGVIAALAGIREGVDQICASSASVAGAVEEQSAVLSDVAQNMSTAAHKTEVVRETVGAAGSLSEAAAKGAEEVLEAARNLSQKAEALQGEMTAFLDEVRAGAQRGSA
jgi:methyl-accepting chemotaxis protein